MRFTSSTSSSNGICSPSSKPRDKATAALAVATAGNPASATIAAVNGSHTLGRMSGVSPSCRERNLAAC